MAISFRASSSPIPSNPPISMGLAIGWPSQSKPCPGSQVPRWRSLCLCTLALCTISLYSKPATRISSRRPLQYSGPVSTRMSIHMHRRATWCKLSPSLSPVGNDKYLLELGCATARDFICFGILWRSTCSRRRQTRLSTLATVSQRMKRVNKEQLCETNRLPEFLMRGDRQISTSEH